MLLASVKLSSFDTMTLLGPRDALSKYLCFIGRSGVSVEGDVLGLSTAPSLFTPVFELLLCWIQLRGIHNGYLDDWLVIWQSLSTLALYKDQSTRHSKQIMDSSLLFLFSIKEHHPQVFGGRSLRPVVAAQQVVFALEHNISFPYG